MSFQMKKNQSISGKGSPQTFPLVSPAPNTPPLDTTNMPSGTALRPPRIPAIFTPLTNAQIRLNSPTFPWPLMPQLSTMRYQHQTSGTDYYSNITSLQNSFFTSILDLHAYSISSHSNVTMLLLLGCVRHSNFLCHSSEQVTFNCS